MIVERVDSTKVHLRLSQEVLVLNKYKMVISKNLL